MDRQSRRFAPTSDGLEVRQMLSTASAAVTAVTNAVGVTTAPDPAAAPGVQVDEGSPVQQTIEAKRTHIKNLPYFIGLLNKDGNVPQPTVQNIQNDLYALVAQLHVGNPHDTAAFNLDLRKAQPYEEIRAQDASALNRDFGAVFVDAGAEPQIVADLQQQLVNLSNAELSEPNSQIVVTNDYATILQLGLGSGRPLVYPDLPSLLGADHNGNDGKIPITHNHKPSLTGDYVYGTDIEIVDDANKVVLGTGAVNTNGVYQVKFTNYLPDGTYTVRVRADDSGFVSDPSPHFTFKVVTVPTKVKVTAKTPTGPVTLK